MASLVSWSDDRVSTLRKLWGDGLSASQIAAALGGVSRSAVLGKLHRLDIASRSVPSLPGGTARPRAARPKPPAPLLPNPRAPSGIEPPQLSDGVLDGPGLVDGGAGLSAHVCRWPLGDPKVQGFSFCGRPAAGRYCDVHSALSVQPGRAARLDRDPVIRRVLAGRA